MIINDEIIDFINKIISNAKTKEELIKNLNTYKDYLVLTESCDEQTLNFIGNIKNKAEKIFELKEYFETFDVRGIISEGEISGEKKTTKTRALKKHYKHYVSDNSNLCGSSYSSGCGCDTIYRRC